MVRLQHSKTYLFISLFIESLNSTMVRLQQTFCHIDALSHCYCLNSTMVRLQQNSGRLARYFFDFVSIPLWFDYNANTRWVL